jgi:hypothetical protein
MRAMTTPTAAGRGRLVFAMDATMSRQPTWDMALQLQADMFHEVKTVGGLDVQLVFFRGAGECQASKWVSDPDALARLMTTVHCAGGYTQIRKVLSHARKETEGKRVNAVVYVGDCMEEEIDDLCGRAGELALLGVPVFLFQEGHDPVQLRELLSAVAVYAAGGRQALEKLAGAGRGAGAQKLLGQMK